MGLRAPVTLVHWCPYVLDMRTFMGYERAQGLNFIEYLNPVNPRDTEKTREKLDEYRSLSQSAPKQMWPTLMMLSMKLKNS